ncbi:hypothetical protein E4U30_007981 [Claviceps sp. LM220 group G6]|nr:hypothetical protein E4U15_002046 [Claviceps sp. LM218 group G6]KAG6098442.1 hypothetical protein E4U30_007981 [Claviceps sp. LM220 group G6]KAG6110643.1 hypothetical protein E4U31_005484 [Claviceps sp. LM219 group G6]KAG6111319.1 hypothetical protein E4U14_002496 [Claviceps sp. LM454 group G7]
MPSRPRPKSWCESGRSTRRNSMSSFHDGSKMQTTLGPCVETCTGGTLQERRCVSSTPSLLEAQKIEVDATSEQTHDGVDAFDPQRPKIGLKQRLHHFTWAWYTLPMSTGGLALLIRSQPYRFPGLDIIGLIVYILNLVIFTTISCLMVARFSIHSGDMSKSIKHPREGFFLPTFFLSVATIITSTDRYVIPKHDIGLVWAVSGAFWAYVAVTLLLAIGQYSYVFAAHRFELHTMMPTWILPIFPIMLSGTIASVIAETQPQAAAIPIIVAGLTCQGLGFAVAVLMYAHMVGRLMSAGLPNREHRPGLFMCVGPPAFTALALVGMAKGLPVNLGTAVDGRFFDTAVVRTMALMSAIFLWSLSLWWFGIAAVAVVQSPPKHFHLGWWAMVFPNTGFILATISIGRELNHDGVLWFATGLSICLVCTYLFVLVNHVKAVIKQDIMYPGRDEDIEDH